MAARSWKVHGAKLALAAAAVVAVGWLAGDLWAVAAVALSFYVTWHLVNLWRLSRWLRNPGAEVPESYGIWSDLYNNFDAMQKRNQKQEATYRSTIGEFRRLTDALPDATLVVDENDDITWFNVAARDLLGLRNPDDIGMPVTNLLRGTDFANWLAVQARIKSPLEIQSPRNDNIWLQVSAVTLRENERLIILRDFTDVHNVEQIRRDFVANISHEMRTPLTVIQGYLELLEQHESSEVSDAVKRMLTQTTQMQTLLSDLLELSRLQSDEIQGEEEVVDVPAMLMQIKEQAEEISRGGHELVFDIDRTLHLSGIAVDLESAFSNLVSNAVKYTPDGGRITVQWLDTEKGPQLIVSDTGIGIPRREIPRLTERFYRVGSDRARQTGGSGLGLAIVKHVLNAHEAELAIQSELGAGSQFRCAFPPDRARRQEVAASAAL
jgi:two-component system phosphate regulon sensor histidine kinase PhoR